MARELLTNVSRHANAHRVALDLFDEGDDVTLNVRDDGVGMDPAVLSRRLSEGASGWHPIGPASKHSEAQWNSDP